jgi:hypothetical protein
MVRGPLPLLVLSGSCHRVTGTWERSNGPLGLLGTSSRLREPADTNQWKGYQTVLISFLAPIRA